METCSKHPTFGFVRLLEASGEDILQAYGLTAAFLNLFIESSDLFLEWRRGISSMGIEHIYLE